MDVYIYTFETNWSPTTLDSIWKTTNSLFKLKILYVILYADWYLAINTLLKYWKSVRSQSLLKLSRPIIMNSKRLRISYNWMNNALPSSCMLNVLPSSWTLNAICMQKKIQSGYWNTSKDFQYKTSWQFSINCILSSMQ